MGAMWHVTTVCSIIRSICASMFKAVAGSHSTHAPLLLPQRIQCHGCCIDAVNDIKLNVLACTSYDAVVSMITLCLQVLMDIKGRKTVLVDGNVLPDAGALSPPLDRHQMNQLTVDSQVPILPLRNVQRAASVGAWHHISWRCVTTALCCS